MRKDTSDVIGPQPQPQPRPVASSGGESPRSRARRLPSLRAAIHRGSSARARRRRRGRRPGCVWIRRPSPVLTSPLSHLLAGVRVPPEEPVPRLRLTHHERRHDGLLRREVVARHQRPHGRIVAPLVVVESDRSMVVARPAKCRGDDARGIVATPRRFRDSQTTVPTSVFFARATSASTR